MRLENKYCIEEISQETFIDGFTGLCSLREPEKFAPWIYGIAKRKALHTVTRRRICISINELAETAETDSLTPEQALLLTEKREAVRRAVYALSPKNRETAELYYIKDLSVAEIAAVTELPQGSIKSRLYEARKKLKGELKVIMEEEMIRKSEYPSSDFVNTVKARISEVKAYRKAYGEDSKEFSSKYEDTERFIKSNTDASERNDALCMYYSSIYTTKYKSLDKMKELTDEAEYPSAVALKHKNAVVDCICGVGNNYKETIRLANAALKYCSGAELHTYISAMRN